MSDQAKKPIAALVERWRAEESALRTEATHWRCKGHRFAEKSEADADVIGTCASELIVAVSEQCHVLEEIAKAHDRFGERLTAIALRAVINSLNGKDTGL